ncbi:MAG: decaprenyl-phosphate phosphoribosyltransferase [Armatimonadetes bacterium]|nr:decaprenyl-phosphate phosphoribosyltransferase [Armatimonadota bacterium]
MRLLIDLIQALRPRQWTKNLLVFAGLLFAQKATDPTAVIEAVEAFLVFCVLAGSMYLINDSLDVVQDRLDPIKCKRPLAAGRITIPVAVTTAIILTILGLAGAYLASGTLLLKVCLAYVGITLLYSGFLKHIVIIDVFAVASGFVLRAVAGAAAVHAVISPWLIICTLLLALFLALAKRRGELMTHGEEARHHRAILAEYTPELLDQMISVMTASTLMSYALYTISDRTVDLIGSTNMLYTVPFVIYGIFRYLYLVHQKGAGGHPDRALLRDWPLMINVLLYGLVVGIIIYLR